ncbi:MAG: regulatory iron-sulfur-containing complex subunit RicT [Bacteroidetes bacterium]|nr:regulatory iron-sulfur-containing complex subunit RicT [Bacteroidota bacterium]
MGCSSCSTEKDGKPGGCRGNGTCGTGSCNKLNVFNWLTDMTLPAGQAPYDVVEVRFKGSRKEFFRNKENISLRTGDTVAVEAMPGHDVGVVSLAGELVRFQMKKKGVTENSDQIRTLYRKAKQNEIDKWCEAKNLETSTLNRTRAIILNLKLSMKLSDVEFQGDGKKATFYYTADDRVDFRELIKRLADEFHVRVEMRQIGMRQEASRLGGIGSCGRELCCSTWLTDFKTVSTGAARYQNLALNPAKLAGQCGKLKCCLNYELDSYMDALKDFPNTNIVIESEKGRASHRKTDIFKRLMWYGYDFVENKEKRDTGEGGDGSWVVLSVDRVKEIIALNKQQVKPVDLKDFEEEEIDTTPDFENVVGQDRIDRMDKKGKKRKKKKKKSGDQPAGQQQSRPQQPGTPQQGKQPQPNRPAQQNKPPGNPQRNQNQQGRQNPQPNRPPQQQSGPPKQNPNQQPKPGGQQQGQNQPNRNRPQRQQPPKSPDTPTP